MKNPKIPENESERLKELESYQLIGLSENDDFDFITSMAAQICGTKISLISLITENKQWFLSHHGLEVRETPKDYAFCAHAINQPNEPFIVEDARKDERFHDNPLTTGDPNVIFYAGIPLVTSNGFPLGTLCTIDDTPKNINKSQLEQLKKLAGQTVKLFENRIKSIELDVLNQELEKKNELLQETQKANKLGIWELDIATGKTTWSDLVYEIHEVSQDFNHNKANAIEFYHPHYRPIITDAITKCISNSAPFDLVCQMITAKDKLIWVRSTGRKLGDKLIGSFQDITEIKHNEIRFKSVIEGTHVGTWEWNVQTGETVYNARWAEIVGYSLEELTPISIETWVKLAHPDDLEESNRRLNACFEKKVDYYEFEARIKHKDGHWVWVYDKGKVFEWTKDGKPLMMYGTHQDITERKQREERLRISEEAFRGNFENAAIGMALLDEKGKWLKINTKVSEIIGYSEEELIKLTFQDITYPDDLNSDLELLTELIEDKRDHYQMEKRYFHKDGHIVHILLAVSMVKNEQGKVVYFISQIIDISESKKLLLDIDYQKDLLSALYNLSPIGIALNEYDTGKFLDVNNKLLEPTGYNKEEFLSLSYWDTTPKEYGPFETTAIQQMESKGSYDLFEKEYIRKDGSRYPIALQGVVIKDSKGKKLIWSFVRDISQEKEAERKLQHAISSLQAILEASKQVSVIATDTKGTITLFNSGAEKLLGYKAEELVGIHNPQLIHQREEVEKRSIELFEKHKKEVKGFDTFVYEAKIGEPTTKEWTYIRNDGTTFPVLLSINTILDHDNIVGYLGVATDISELKKVEKEIKSLLDITNEQNGRLRNFAHIVSHNLRSHSGGISGILDLIQMEQPDILKNELFALLILGAENLNQTVNDLTEIVKVNLTQADVSKVNIHEVIQKNIEILNIQIMKAKFEIINNVDKNLTVKGVPAYFDSIVLNMITNAIKYRSEERASYLKIYADVETEQSMITLFFKDNGLGIDLKKNGDKLFGLYKTFHRHDDSRGVGLFITKNQIESMDGKIEIASEVNLGTTFKITLPK
ncbi:PAS domain S-box protein [Winogradskyella pacifica]|uniref:histidine kinase n=1 Tax=Winogradskyella pacifica TaxID=664642 RepID=A0A3D9N162_9FLAO|nr:PAS domain S-box protein [Winogradskyella pacifica]REE25418.1 PAS domain S-box-containing protein [Winogradskyella pacifica]